MFHSHKRLSFFFLLILFFIDCGGVFGLKNNASSSAGGAKGVLDRSFGNNGFVIHDGAAGGSDSDEANSIVLDDAGNIYAAGYSKNSNNKDMIIWKYNSSGSIDINFGNNGFALYDNQTIGNSDDEANAIALDHAGNIYVAGYNSNGRNKDMVIWKYNRYGNLDAKFGNNGFVFHDDAAGGNDNDEAHAIALDDAGNIYVAGYSNNGTSDDMVIWKYNSSGSLDANFGNNGFVSHGDAAGGNGNDEAHAIALDDAGNIYAAGYSNNGTNDDMVIWKYNSSGSLDVNFGNNGFALYDNQTIGNSDDEANAIALDHAGNIYVAGYNSNGRNKDMVIWKYNRYGNLDTSFGDGAGFVTDGGIAGGNTNDGNSILVDGVGNIYVAGSSHNGTDFDMIICKYDSSGNLDTNFGINGYVIFNSNAGDIGRSMVLDSEGRLYVAGSSNGAMAIWRYK